MAVPFQSRAEPAEPRRGEKTNLLDREVALAKDLGAFTVPHLARGSNDGLFA